MSGVLGHLLAISENYPDLKSNQNFLALQSQLEGTENRIEIARRDYNAAVQDYNTELVTIPGSLWASTIFRATSRRRPSAASAGANPAPVVNFDQRAQPRRAARRTGGTYSGRPLAFALLASLVLHRRPAAQFPALTGGWWMTRTFCPTPPADLTDKLAALEQKTSRQLVVVTVPSLQGYEISDYGYQLGRAWGIGQAKLNNGVLFIIAPTEHKMRIEVGYGLEPILTDAFSAIVIQTPCCRSFKAGRFQWRRGAGRRCADPAIVARYFDGRKRAAAAREQTVRNRTMAAGRHLLFLVIAFIFVHDCLRAGGWGLLICCHVAVRAAAVGGGGLAGRRRLFRRRRIVRRRRRLGELVMTISHDDAARIEAAIRAAQSRSSRADRLRVGAGVVALRGAAIHLGRVDRFARALAAVGVHRNISRAHLPDPTDRLCRRHFDPDAAGPSVCW